MTGDTRFLGLLQAAQQLWTLLHRRAAVCAGCRMCGLWRSCAHCKAVFYCSRICQTKHWPQHRSSCDQLAQEMHADADRTAVF